MNNEDRLRKVLDALRDATGAAPAKTAPNQWASRCPGHDDQHASLSVSTGVDGRVLLHCHAGCTTPAVLGGARLRLGDLFEPKNGKDRENFNSKKIVATYDYANADGELVYQVVRFDPKDFRQRKPDGSGGWTWKLNGVRRILYRLPEILTAPVDEPVLVVEGEKDADNLVKLGFKATCNPGGAGKWGRLSDDSALRGRKVVIIADKDAPGRSHANDVAMRLRGRAADVKVLELPGGHVKDVSDWISGGGTAEQLRELINGAPAPDMGSQPLPKPKILIAYDEHRVIEETIDALTADVELYQRGGALVRVMRDALLKDGVVRDSGAATIGIVPPANLRERMTRWCEYVKINDRNEEAPAHPTPWLVAGVDARGDWPGIRPLMGVSDAPVLRADGSVWQTPGYDAQTGVLYEPPMDVEFPPIPDHLTLDDADAAMGRLLDLVGDFKFESEDHRAAWLAGLLTPLARFAFDGPSPLFLFDANVRGAGKTLLSQVIGRVVLGREMPVSSYTHDSEEMRKKVTSIAIAGDRMVLLDNLGGIFGNDVLDRALTSTRWQDRILGRSQQVDLPLTATWYATGNNVQIAADTTRRCLHVRLDVLTDSPESRGGFKYPRLLEHVDRNRPAFLTDGLIILAAYCRAGKPKPEGLSTFGSFEGWSDLVRGAVLWLSMPDPCSTRVKLMESADVAADSLAQLITAWKEYDWANNGLIVSDMLATLYPVDHKATPTDENSHGMRAALENLTGAKAGQNPGVRAVANKLKGFRRRVYGGAFLDVDPSRNSNRGALWRVFEVPDKGSRPELKA